MIRVRLNRAAPSALQAEAPAPAGFGSGEYAAVSLLRRCPPRIREVANRTDRAPETQAESSCALNAGRGLSDARPLNRPRRIGDLRETIPPCIPPTQGQQ